MAGGTSRRRGSAAAAASEGAPSRRRGAADGGRGRARASASASTSAPISDLERASPPEVVVVSDEQWLHQEEEEEPGMQLAVPPAAPAPLLPPPTAPPSQAFALTAAPMYPNSVRWSDENLIAVAAGHMVTILNPAGLAGPRSFVAVTTKPSFDFGTVTSDDLKTSVLLPITLARDTRAVIRSIHWSPQGVASNGGCLLAVGTTDFRVKIYSPPLNEFRSEWVELVDLSEYMVAYCMKYEFLEHDGLSLDTTSLPCRKRQAPEQISLLENSAAEKRRRTNGSISSMSMEPGTSSMVDAGVWNPDNGRLLAEDMMKVLHNKRARKPSFPPQSPQAQEPENVTPGSKKKKAKLKEGATGSSILITSAQYMSRTAMLTPLAVAWSPKCHCSREPDGSSSEARGPQSYVFVAAGTKAGMVAFWRLSNPQVYSVEKVSQPDHTSFLGFLHTHDSWVTCVEWGRLHSETTHDLVLATGCSDGSVKLWLGDSKELVNWEPSAQLLPWTLLIQVSGRDNIPASCLSLKLSLDTPNVLLAVGKSSGGVSAWECSKSGACSNKATVPRAHEQTVMGVCWTKNENSFYSCGQDNSLKMWEFRSNQLLQVESTLLSSEVPATAPDLPSSALESFFGLALSPADLALAMVRGIAAEVVDPMYQSRSQKGVIQMIWVGGQDDTKNDAFEDDDINSLHTRAVFSITSSWTPRVTSALVYIEHHAQAVVLWDVLTVLAFLKNVCGLEILASIFQSWLSGSKFVTTGVPEACCWSTSDLKAALPRLSCRTLQTAVTIYRRILLHDLRASLQSEGLEAMQNSVTRTQLTQEQQVWLESLWCIEHELRERLMFLALGTAIRSKTAQSSASPDMTSTALLMSQWILANKRRVSPQILQLTEDVQKNYERSSPVHESCSFCEQNVPLDYLELGYCRNTSLNHRLQRCSTSLRVCSFGPSWFCSCCARNALQQAPEVFFSLSSREDAEKVPLVSALVPRCPFCGILMQKIVPEFLLTPSLV